MAALGLVAVPNPPAFMTRAARMLDRLGPVRSAHPLNVKDMLVAGIPVVAASDFPGLYPADPLQGIQAMVTRIDAAGESRAPAQAITVAEAVRCYTSAPAWAGFQENQTGTIAVGKLADLTVLARDPFVVPTDEISSIKVLATVVGGRAVYADESAALDALVG